jgi:hypothetical protein
LALLQTLKSRLMLKAWIFKTQDLICQLRFTAAKAKPGSNLNRFRVLGGASG